MNVFNKRKGNMGFTEEMVDMRRVTEFFGGIARKTIYEWMKKKGFPRPYKISGKNFWKKSEIEIYLEAQRKG
jgi:predicted DNA-binding transcriptional regulator AlpA